jgi:hypothetical protein
MKLMKLALQVESFAKVRSSEFIREGVEDNSMQVKLTAIISQLHGRLKDTATKKPFSLTALLSILSKNGISVSEEQFREMIQSPPLSNLISDVKGNEIIFKGDDNPPNDIEAPDETTGTLDKMAHRAAKARD